MAKWVAASLCLHCCLLLPFFSLRKGRATTHTPTTVIIELLPKLTPFKVPPAAIGITGKRVNFAIPPAPSEEPWRAELRREQFEPTESKQFKYHSLFGRISSIVEVEWQGRVRVALKKIKVTKGRLYNTLLWLTLDSSGRVIKAEVVGVSGLPQLDEAALISFRDKYFPNLPNSLIDKDGFARLLWSCKVQM